MKEYIWSRPQITPLPALVEGREGAVRLLSGGGWRLWRSRERDFCPKDLDGINREGAGWEDVEIPMQLKPFDREYAYAYELEIPAQWRGKRIFLRFDGVNCKARVMIDGKPVREHYGGFVSWDCEITDAVAGGGRHLLALGVKDDPGGICTFHFGGIIRDVSLFTVPQVYLSRFHGETSFDAAYRDAELKIYAQLRGGDGEISFSLTDPYGRETALGKADLKEGAEQCISYKITSPLKWDSEHPYLYMLTASVITEGSVRETAVRRIGFRQIEKRGREVFLNGDRLKLRGINRHDTHPLRGRAITHELVEEDVRLFKEANINFIRTSHYPPRPDFLDLCDEYGIYVEDETAVAFLGQEIGWRENDPAFKAQFMDQFAELIERDRSHPCVILWSLANESVWGRNLALENAYAHQEDPGRLTIFSYPVTQHEDDERADIFSMHYAAWDQEPDALVDSFNRSRMEAPDWPVLHDESTHIPCYDRGDQRRDPGVRDFWGQTIRQFWDRLWKAEGVLGCAIWAGLDEVRALDDKNAAGGYVGAPWGILDGWRRRKPEFWHVRKAYSPIRLTGGPKEEGGKILLPIENRFNHTNLKETDVFWQTGDREGHLPGPDVAPGAQGILAFPVSSLSESGLTLSFTDPFGNLVEDARFHPGETEPELPVLDGGTPDIRFDRDNLTVEGEDFILRFSKETGLITQGYVRGVLTVTGGPYLHLTGLYLKPWQLNEIAGEVTDGCAIVTITGGYGEVRVRFRVRIDRTGLMETAYELLDMPYPSPRKLAMRVGDDTDSGGYEEVGIYFCVPPQMDLLSWKRTGLWNTYPDWHIGRLSGQAQKHGPCRAGGEEAAPSGEWQLDEKDSVLFGKYDVGRRGTRDFSSMKSHITYACLSNPENGTAFEVLSDGRDSVRVRLTHNPDAVIGWDDPRVDYRGSWSEQENAQGSGGRTEMWSDTEGDTCTCHFYGTGCAWISSYDILGGMAQVSVDGQVRDSAVCLGFSQPRPGIARGYEKDPHRLVYAVENLGEGEHTLQIMVKGEKTPGSGGAYVFVDQFLVFGKEDYGDSHLIIDSEYNYPELSWGCYTKEPIQVDTGYCGRVYTRLTARD